MGAFNQLNGAIFDAAAIEARISAVDGKSIYNQRDGGILDFDSLARRLTALDGKIAVGQGGIEFDVDSFMRRLAAIEAGGNIDPDAALWGVAVGANGGTYSANTLSAVSAFCLNAKTNGYWSKLFRINLLCGDQLTAARVPLKVGGGNTIDTNVSFVSGNYTEATGLTGNGATKYLRTGFVASTGQTANDTHLAVYNRSASGTGGAISIGALVTVSQCLIFYAPSSDAQAYSDSYSTAIEIVGGSLATPFGLLTASRTASNANVIYQGSTSKASAATSGGTLPNLEFYVFGLNSAGAPATLTAHTLAAYSIGSGLTAADVTAYNTDMQTFQTALGRNV